MLKLHFVTNSWLDIFKKLQKLDNWKDRNLEELLREAQKVYVQRDEEKQKQKARIMLITVEQVNQGRAGSKNQKQRPPQRGYPKEWGIQGPPKVKGKNKCYRYRKEGHFKRECPELKREEKVIPLKTFDEE